RSAPQCDFHSFPTRRSSDLFPTDLNITAVPDSVVELFQPAPILARSRYGLSAATLNEAPILNAHAPSELIFEVPAGTHELKAIRSEEHTSELQSRENLVCRL